MNLSFEHTVSALCYSLMQEHCQTAELSVAFPHNQVVRFVLRQYQRMPDFLKIPIAILTVSLDGWTLLRRGTCFHQLPHGDRWQQILVWNNAPFSVCRDLIRFYSSLTIFAWYSLAPDADIVQNHGSDTNLNEFLGT